MPKRATTIISVPVTDVEKTRIQRAAKKRKLKSATFVRDAALREAKAV